MNSEKVLRKLFSFRRKALNYIWVQIHRLKRRNIFFIATSQKQGMPIGHSLFFFFVAERERFVPSYAEACEASDGVDNRAKPSRQARLSARRRRLLLRVLRHSRRKHGVPPYKRRHSQRSRVQGLPRNVHRAFLVFLFCVGGEGEIWTLLHTIKSVVCQMMHRLRRYDVFRSAQNDVAPLRSAMM